MNAWRKNIRKTNTVQKKPFDRMTNTLKITKRAVWILKLVANWWRHLVAYINKKASYYCQSVCWLHQSMRQFQYEQQAYGLTWDMPACSNNNNNIVYTVKLPAEISFNPYPGSWGLNNPVHFCLCVPKTARDRTSAFGTLSRTPSAIYRRIKFCHTNTGNLSMVAWKLKV